MIEDLAAFWLFKRIVELGSFTKAAKEAGIYKNSASVRIKNLEQRLGFQLLERTTAKVWLTEAGKRYYNAYNKVAEELERARRTLKGGTPVESPPESSLRILATSALDRRFIASLLPDFLSKHPGLTVTLASQGDTQSFDLELRCAPPSAALPGWSVVSPSSRVLA